MTWTRAVDLENWAGHLEARGLFPLLVRKLIAATSEGLTKLNIPAQEQIGRPGFDGSVEIVRGNQFVPAGSSVWEMGVDKNPKKKAQDDFSKRSAAASADSTFVFVTPRTWLKKDEWIAGKTASAWKAVTVHDVNDLEHWLETAHGVDAWIAAIVQRLPSGLQSLRVYWDGLSAIATHRLAPDVFVSSREAEVEEVMKWLTGSADSFFLKTASLNDGVDFLSALAAIEASKLAGDTPIAPTPAQVLLEDAIVVYVMDEWRHLVMAKGHLLLVPAPTLPMSARDVAAAVEAGHYVFVSGPRGVVPEERALSLRGLANFELEQSLQSSGFSDAEASNFAKSSCGSSTILKRLITRHSETIFPEWSTGDEAMRLAPFALLGGWLQVDPRQSRKPDESSTFFATSVPIDIDVVTTFVGCNQEQLDSVVTRWSTSNEPLFTRFGEHVVITSREDAWYLLGHAVTDQQLKRFADLAELVLDEDNPAFELDAEKRWAANIYGKSHSISSEMRRALVESLALIAVYPIHAGAKRDSKMNATVNKVVKAVLPKGTAWQRWASLAENLRTIAEASPELFLQRVEEDLNTSNPAIHQLFVESMGEITGRRLHCDLLWALEVLAWSPQYLTRVSVILANLAAHTKIAENYANTPVNSLREIFLLWLWHTNASNKHRLEALDSVLRASPAIGWELLKELLPTGQTAFSQNTAMPRWRNWAHGWSREAIQKHRREYTRSVARLAISKAGTDPARWADIVDKILRVSQETTDEALTALQRLAEVYEENTNTTYDLWNTLRELIDRHERFEDSNWSFKRIILAPLARIRDAISPTDPILKYRWLFQSWVELSEPKIAEDYGAHDKALRDLRSAALKDVIEKQGQQGMLKLIELGGDGIAIGSIVAEDKLLTAETFKLPELLSADDESPRRTAESYVWCRFVEEGWKFIESLSIAQWTSEQICSLALALPSRRDVWDWVASLDSIEDNYWRRTAKFIRDVSIPDVAFATESLIRRGRPFTAIRLLHSPSLQNLQLPSAMIASVLEAGMLPTNAENEKKIAKDVFHDVQKLVKTLQDDASFDRTRLALIEWGYLPLLDTGYSATGPNTLVSAMSQEPQLLVKMLSAAYRGENESANAEVTDDQEVIRAHRAHAFLEGLEKLPGILEPGTFNPTRLTWWIETVRQSAQESGHGRVCETTIGAIFARALKDDLDAPWIASDVAPLLEQLGTEGLFRGMAIGFFNSRGAAMRGALEGGEQERTLASKFRQRADNVRASSPGLANTFSTLAESYESDADRWDEDAARMRLGR